MANMLKDEELVTAFVNNVDEWSWDLYPTIALDEDTAKAVKEVVMMYRDLER